MDYISQIRLFLFILSVLIGIREGLLLITHILNKGDEKYVVPTIRLVTIGIALSYYITTIIYWVK
jgi:hypothetical protein